MDAFFVLSSKKRSGILALMTTRHFQLLSNYMYGDGIQWRKAIGDGIRVFLFAYKPQDFHVGWVRPLHTFVQSGLVTKCKKFDFNIPRTNGPAVGQYEAELFRTTDVDVDNAFAYCGIDWGKDGKLLDFIRSIQPFRYVPILPAERVGFYNDRRCHTESFVGNGTLVGYGKCDEINWPFYQRDGDDKVLRHDELAHHGLTHIGDALPFCEGQLPNIRRGTIFIESC